MPDMPAEWRSAWGSAAEIVGQSAIAACAGFSNSPSYRSATHATHSNPPQQQPLKRIQRFVDFPEVCKQDFIAWRQCPKGGVAANQIEDLAKCILAVNMPQDRRAKSARVDRDRHAGMRVIENERLAVASRKYLGKFGARDGLVIKKRYRVGITIAGFAIW